MRDIYQIIASAMKLAKKQRIIVADPADAAKKLQRISIGPVSRGDADAVYAVCVSRGLVAAGLYKSEWSV